MTMRADIAAYHAAFGRMQDAWEELGDLEKRSKLTRADAVRFYELIAHYEKAHAEFLRLESTIDAELTERRKDAHATIIAALAG